MKLSIGTATFDDFDGVYFTLQAIKMYHANLLKDIELIVVDNQPKTKGSGYIKNLLENWSKTAGGAKYIPMDSPQGTTQPRNRIFAEATGEIVMCMDSHVLLAPGSLAWLLTYFQHNPNSKDLVSGPMLYDDLLTPNTHFDNFWRSQMWGIWGNAWRCSQDCGFLFTPHQNLDGTRKGMTDYHTLDMRFEKVTHCPKCGKEFPVLPYGPHVPALLAGGSYEAVNDESPFETPGMGLGLFACHKEAWLGFNEHFRGFGGEELYIHEKFRQAGGRSICLPWLKWGHRFGRPNGAPYQRILTVWNKVRNYVLGAQELGLPLEPIKAHFNIGQPGSMEQWAWDQLVENAIGLESGPVRHTVVDTSPKENPVPQRPQPRATINTQGELVAWAKTLPRDLDEHLDTLTEWAGKNQHVTELTNRRESTIGLLAAANKVVSYQSEVDQLLPKLVDMFPTKLDLHAIPYGYVPPTIEETDLLFIDPVGTYAQLSQVLTTLGKHVRKHIVVHDTDLYYITGSDGTKEKPTKGLLIALREFMTAHPEWTVVFHTKTQHGLTVLSRVLSDKPKPPGTIKLASNFAKAMLDHAADGFKQVTAEQYKERSEICTLCPQRNNNVCSVCGCGLAAKLQLASSYCPLGHWDKIEATTTTTPEVH